MRKDIITFKIMTSILAFNTFRKHKGYIIFILNIVIISMFLYLSGKSHLFFIKSIILGFIIFTFFR